MTYNWSLPNLAPLLVPWLAVLVLLALKPNRRASAWWIWLPLGLFAAVEAALSGSFGFLPESATDMLVGLVTALGFGLAAVWLLATYLVQRYRVVTWLCILAALIGFSALTFAAKQSWDPEALAGAVALLIVSFVLSLALTLASVFCRSRYRPIRLLMWLLIALLGMWTVLSAPFVVIGLILSHAGLSGSAVLGVTMGVLITAGISGAIFLPFLVLSFANTLFRERLKQLLHVKIEAPPVVSAAPSPDQT